MSNLDEQRRRIGRILGEDEIPEVNSKTLRMYRGAERDRHDRWGERQRTPTSPAWGTAKCWSSFLTPTVMSFGNDTLPMKTLLYFHGNLRATGYGLI